MSSKRAVRRSMQRRQCGSKTGYATETQAVAAAKAASKHLGEPFRSYRCQFCSRWHKGHTRGK